MCVRSCESATFTLLLIPGEKQCVASCGGLYVGLDKKKCLKTCPGKNRFQVVGKELFCVADTQQCKFEELQSGGVTRCSDYCPQFLESGRCVSMCSPTMFVDVSDCIPRCPNYKYIDGQLCKDACVPAVYDAFDFSCVASLDLCPVYWYNATSKHYSCLKACPANLTRIGRNCTEVCPSSLPLLSVERECVASCGAKHVLSGAKCLTACPDDAPYVDSARKCVKSCPRAGQQTFLYKKLDGNTYCTTDGNACSFLRVDGATTTCFDFCAQYEVQHDARSHCLDQCPGPFVRVAVAQLEAKKCISSCPAGSLMLATTSECVQQCPDGFLVSGAKCITQCASGMELSNGICQKTWLKRNTWAVALLTGFGIVIAIVVAALLTAILGKRVRRVKKNARAQRVAPRRMSSPALDSRVTAKPARQGLQKVSSLDEPAVSIELPNVSASTSNSFNGSAQRNEGAHASPRKPVQIRYAKVQPKEQPRRRFPDFDQIILEGVKEKMAAEEKRARKHGKGPHKGPAPGSGIAFM